jgi:hypothetical protein
MSIYRDRTTGEIKNRLQLKKETTMSLPSQWNDSVLEALNVDAVTQQDMPDYDQETEKVELNTVAEQVDGEWVQGWTVSTMTAEEQAVKEAESAEAARQHRDALLQQTDFYALSDVTMSAEMTTYRQALRDITSHADFPYLADEAWPTAPEA